MDVGATPGACVRLTPLVGSMSGMAVIIPHHRGRFARGLRPFCGQHAQSSMLARVEHGSRLCGGSRCYCFVQICRCSPAWMLVLGVSLTSQRGYFSLLLHMATGALHNSDLLFRLPDTLAARLAHVKKPAVNLAVLAPIGGTSRGGGGSNKWRGAQCARRSKAVTAAEACRAGQSGTLPSRWHWTSTADTSS